YSDPHTAMDAGAITLIPAGQRTLPHPALGAAGGGTIEVDTQDKSGMVTKRPQFYARIEGMAPEGGAGGLGVPGERGLVRFDLPAKPLLSQWIDRMWKLLQERGPDL